MPSFRTFIDWWLRSLSRLVPRVLLDKLHANSATLVLRVEREQIDVCVRHRGELQALGLLSMSEPPEHPRARLRTWLDALEIQPERLSLSVGPKRYLQREIRLPLAAKPHLKETLGYQLAELTPFPPETIFYDCGPIKGSEEGKKFKAWFIVVPDKVLDPAIALAREIGTFAVDGVTVRPKSRDALQLSVRRLASDGQKNREMNWAVAGLVALFLVVLSGHLFNQSERLRFLERALEEARMEALEATELTARIQQHRTQRAALMARLSTRPDTIALFADLTRRLDDQTWIEQLELRSRSLSFRGVSQDAAAIIARLETSDHVEDVSFKTAVARDANRGGERFELQARLSERAP